MATLVQSPVLIRLAEHAANIEKNYKTDRIERFRAISCAIVECITYALDHDIITSPEDPLPDYITEMLQKVYTYLGSAMLIC